MQVAKLAAFDNVERHLEMRSICVMTEHLSDKVERFQWTEGDLVAGEDVLFDHFQVNYVVDET